ncbi:hypothetical protein AsAng_0012030 [Aureispira anguillae]|uniref:Uncharacterized protein n=1 Tax=Aureispira anguillae TaxID=2864201 RepID=A0A916DR79_9BACT|nr:hypothetical protein AsAng_0012030 [Aureispira anguillae]
MNIFYATKYRPSQIFIFLPIKTYLHFSRIPRQLTLSLATI